MTQDSTEDLPRRVPGASGYEKFLTGNLIHAVYEPAGGWAQPSEELFTAMWHGLQQS